MASVEEIVAVMCQVPDSRHGRRVRAMIVVLWRAGLRIQEALALSEHDLDHDADRWRPWSGAAVRSEFRRLAARAGMKLRDAHALELARAPLGLSIPCGLEVRRGPEGA